MDNEPTVDSMKDTERNPRHLKRSDCLSQGKSKVGKKSDASSIIHNNKISFSGIVSESGTGSFGDPALTSSNMVTVVMNDELMEYSPSEMSKPVDLSNNNNSSTNNNHLGQDAPPTILASFGNNNNNNNNDSSARSIVSKHSSLGLNCSSVVVIDGGNSANSNSSSNSGSAHNNGSSNGGSNGILCGNIGMIRASSPLSSSRTSTEQPTSNGAGNKKLSFSVENILDPNKFTGKNSALHSTHHKNLLPSPKLLATHPPSSNFRFAYKDIHGKFEKMK